MASNKKLAAEAAELQTQADGPAEAEEGRAPGVYVAKDKTVTSKIGVLVGGISVKAKYFAGGEETLNNLVKRGYCVRVK